MTDGLRQDHEREEAAYVRGQKQGVDDATLASHTEHLRAINGSVDRMEVALRDLEREIQQHGIKLTGEIGRLDKELNDSIRQVSSDVRQLNEDQRSRDVKVEATRSALAEDTERRRDALEEGGWQLTRWQQVVGLVIAALSSAAAIYFATGR